MDRLFILGVQIHIVDFPDSDRIVPSTIDGVMAPSWHNFLHSPLIETTGLKVGDKVSSFDVKDLGIVNLTNKDILVILGHLDSLHPVQACKLFELITSGVIQDNSIVPSDGVG